MDERIPPEMEKKMDEHLTELEKWAVIGRVIENRSMADVCIDIGISTTKLREILDKWDKIIKA